MGVFMFPMYLLPLAFAIGATWVFVKTSEDISAVLAAATALISIIWGFAISPWPLQLLLLVILLGFERLYLKKRVS
jgi:hypothetical protein